MKVYKDKSNPLEEVALYELEDRELYVIDDGKRVRFNEEGNEFDIIQNSELNIGELLDDLDEGPVPHSLGLFWKLMDNKGK